MRTRKWLLRERRETIISKITAVKLRAKANLTIKMHLEILESQILNNQLRLQKQQPTSTRLNHIMKINVHPNVKAR